MDSENQKRVMDGRSCEGKRKKSTRGSSAWVNPEPLAVAPPIDIDSNMPLTFAPPDEYLKRFQAMSSNIAVNPAENRIEPLRRLVTADSLRDRPRNSISSENSGAEHMLEVHDPEHEIESQINMEIEENTARQAQRQMRQFNSTFTELCAGFETSKKKIKELGKQVNNLEGEIQRLKDKEAHWDEKKKEIERERDEAREEARKAVNEKRSLEQKLEKAAKQYKTGLGSFVAHLANGEGKSLGDYVNELVNETPCNNRAPADEAEHEGNVMGP